MLNKFGYDTCISSGRIMDKFNKHMIWVLMAIWEAYMIGFGKKPNYEVHMKCVSA